MFREPQKPLPGTARQSWEDAMRARERHARWVGIATGVALGLLAIAVAWLAMWLTGGS
jgi:hypothetical protein